jgi:hypothetical protein
MLICGYIMQTHISTLADLEHSSPIGWFDHISDPPGMVAPGIKSHCTSLCQSLYIHICKYTLTICADVHKVTSQRVSEGRRERKV